MARADEHRRPLALMMIDIDHFKQFNDRYGHVRGDACLRAVGETLSRITLDNAVVVARYGGEEFALLLPGLDIEHTTALAEAARRAIEELLIAHDDTACGVVTISIGARSWIPAEGLSPAGLVDAADRALYAAKRRGRNAVVAHETIAAARGKLTIRRGSGGHDFRVRDFFFDAGLRFCSGGAQIMPSSFIPSGSVK